MGTAITYKLSDLSTVSNSALINREPAFVTTWSVTTGDTIVIPTVSGWTYNGTIDWFDSSGDPVPSISGSFTAWNDSVLSPDFTGLATDTYTCKIEGTFEAIDFNARSTSAAKLITIENLGIVGWRRLNNGFRGCTNLTTVTAGTCDTTTITGINDFISTWYSCSSLTSIDLTGVSLAGCVGGVYFSSIIAYCTSLTSFDLSVVEGLNNIVRINFFAQGCTSLTTFTMPTNAQWDMDNLDDAQGWFNGCTLSQASAESVIVAVWLNRSTVKNSEALDLGSSPYGYSVLNKCAKLVASTGQGGKGWTLAGSFQGTGVNLGYDTVGANKVTNTTFSPISPWTDGAATLTVPSPNVLRMTNSSGAASHLLYNSEINLTFGKAYIIGIRIDNLSNVTAVRPQHASYMRTYNSPTSSPYPYQMWAIAGSPYPNNAIYTTWSANGSIDFLSPGTYELVLED